MKQTAYVFTIYYKNMQAKRPLGDVIDYLSVDGPYVYWSRPHSANCLPTGAITHAKINMTLRNEGDCGGGLLCRTRFTGVEQVFRALSFDPNHCSTESQTGKNISDKFSARINSTARRLLIRSVLASRWLTPVTPPRAITSREIDRPLAAR